MEGFALSSLAAWESFYVIVGSSAAALTGLQFVVIVLGAEIDSPANTETTRAFGTPTIVHFCVVLLVSAIMSAPWHVLWSPGLGLALCGAAGFVYVLIVIGRTRRQKTYSPVLEDWLWHGALPLTAYVTVLVAAILLPRYPQPCLFVTGAVAVLVLFVGIHNAWDAVTYIALHRGQSEAEKQR